jgi:formylglycine-generating enzyme required for sulfatase activity
VGSFGNNDLDFYDIEVMSRNGYDKKGYESHKKKNPFITHRGSDRVVRGGSYIDNAVNIRYTGRNKSIPAMQSSYIGFRLIIKKSE